MELSYDKITNLTITERRTYPYPLFSRAVKGWNTKGYSSQLSCCKKHLLNQDSALTMEALHLTSWMKSS